MCSIKTQVSPTTSVKQTTSYGKYYFTQKIIKSEVLAQRNIFLVYMSPFCSQPTPPWFYFYFLVAFLSSSVLEGSQSSSHPIRDDQPRLQWHISLEWHFLGGGSILRRGACSEFVSFLWVESTPFLYELKNLVCHLRPTRFWSTYMQEY